MVKKIPNNTKDLERRIKMLRAHIAVRTLRPTRRKKMQAELTTLLQIQTQYTQQVEQRKKALQAIQAQIAAQNSQTKLEQVAPELLPIAKEAEDAHEALLQGVPTEETLEGIAETEEKKERHPERCYERHEHLFDIETPEGALECSDCGERSYA